MKLEYENITPDDGSSFKLIHWLSENDRFFWHQHPEYELIYVREGSGRLHVGDYLSSYAPGDLLFIGPNLPHTGLGYGVIGRHEEIIVQLKEDFMMRSFGQIPEMTRIRKLFDFAKRGLVFKGSQTKDIGDRLAAMIAQSSIERLISLLGILKDLSLTEDFIALNPKDARFDFRHKDEERISKIYRFVEQHYQQTIELATVADMANMTVPSFCRYFKKMTRITFTDFVNEFRVKQACKLLMTTKIIADICFESGFNNVSHFNKTFKAVMGESPRNYRKSLIS